MLPQKRKHAGDLLDTATTQSQTESNLQKPAKLQRLNNSESVADGYSQISTTVNHKSTVQNEDADSDREQKNSKIKWKSLEHHGVTFFPSY